ncbi:GL25506 [Drosophila persimilis]|uniref:GL25506 n=1 Tax=Drosophila persimilis TaxID=7234 RepID=B4GU96_DROPE|nr:GL25506 [Drosophila persimilis]
MATLEDKLLGEKLEYYCSSSEGEDNDHDGDDEKDAGRKGAAGGLTINTDPDAAPAGGFRQQGSTNTGPKGVVKDWQRFKQLEAERRDDTERQRLAMAKN